MPSFNIIKASTITRSPRVIQLEGLFDVPRSKRSLEQWSGSFEYPDDWSIGAIVGPSGAGKTTLAKELYGDNLISGFEWDDNSSIVDAFPKELSIKDITTALSSVGFSSPPSWLRPYNVLSNGEKFRANLARMLTSTNELVAIDEFTSVVDRTVAKVASHALQKAMRRHRRKLVAVSVHYDILDWLEPDWVYQPHTGEYYTGRYLHQRPEIKLKVRRIHHSAWRVFRKHHYLDTNLNTSAICFCAFMDDAPVAFSSILHFPHNRIKDIKREHRTVCLPDFQGVGIGNALSDYVGATLKALGYRFQSQTSHPGMIYSRNRSKNWAMIAKPNMKEKAMVKGVSLTKANGRYSISTRLRATFEYIGPALDKVEAQAVFTGIEPKLLSS